LFFYFKVTATNTYRQNAVSWAQVAAGISLQGVTTAHAREQQPIKCKRHSVTWRKCHDRICPWLTRTWVLLCCV